jgi:hypothetical protein
MCQICRVDKQTGHHAMVGCPKAVALRFEMRKHWLLSDEKQFCYIGPDWLLMLTSPLDDALKAKVLLQFWRAWHLQKLMI